MVEGRPCRFDDCTPIFHHPLSYSIDVVNPNGEMSKTELIHRAAHGWADMTGLFEPHEFKRHVVPPNDSTMQIKVIEF